ncbi:MAG: response regulator transcription factor [Leadbetterella sp.]|nr:response regulator transcription factor [Leadbetterella sp.]
MKKIKILIADDHQLVAESLSLLLKSEEEFEIIGIVNNGWQALSFVEKYGADIVLTDYIMPLLNGVELAMRLKEQAREVKVIMLTMNEQADHIRESIQAGAHGYVMKSAEKAELVKAIKSVYRGGKYFSDKTLKKLAEIPNKNSISGKTKVEDVLSLTRREVEIVRLISEDLNNTEISERLNISPTTVETHRRNLMKKIGVNTVLGLVRWGLKHGVVKEL